MHFICVYKRFIGRLLSHFLKFYLQNTVFWPLNARSYCSPTSWYIFLKFGTANFTCEVSIVLKNQPVLPTRCRDRALRSQTALQKSKNGVFTKKVMGTHNFGKFRFWKVPAHPWYVSVGPSGSNWPGRRFKRNEDRPIADQDFFRPFWTPTLVGQAGDAFQILSYFRFFMTTNGHFATFLRSPSA